MPCLSFEQTLRTLSGIFFPTHVVAGSFRRAPLKRLARFLDAAPHGLASAVAPSRTHLHPRRARGTRAQPPRTPAVRKTFGPKRQPHALLPTLDPPSRTARPSGPESVPETKAPASPRAGSSPAAPTTPQPRLRSLRSPRLPAPFSPAPRAASLRPKRRRSCRSAAGLDRRVRLAWRLPHVGLADRPWRLGCHGYAPALIAAASPASHWVVPGPKA